MVLRRGAARLIADALKTTNQLAGDSGRRPLVRADSAFYGHSTVTTAIRGGADVSVTVRLRRADPDLDLAGGGRRDSVHRVTSRKKAEHVTGRLVVRRIPDLNPGGKDGQQTLFGTWRFHAFFTTPSPALADTVAADRTHRGHAIIEQVHADLKNSALADLPSGKFAANAAWLVLAVMAFNLTRAAAALAGTGLAKSTTATIRRKLIAVPARVASSARRVTLHLPTAWPWETAWLQLLAHGSGPPPAPTT